MRLPEDVEKILGETYEQRLKQDVKAVELPCKEYHRYRDPVFVQLKVAGDQRITCPKCGRQAFVTWSKREDGIKWAK